MPADTLAAAGRFERFLADCLAPAVARDASPLHVEVHQCAEPISVDEAARAGFRPVEIGWEWGPVWSTAWFRVRGSVPSSLAGRPAALRFSCGSEALLWRDGVPHHGLDANRDTVLLFESAPSGAPIDLLVEAACNHHLGQLGTHWDGAEFLKRWQGPSPGRLERCELVAPDAIAWRLHWSYRFALQLMRELPPESARAQELLGALTRATALVDAANVPATAPAALQAIESSLALPAGGAATTCHAVGHAHIDTAWLWPIRESKRKCLRTFATALRTIENNPGFRFLCSQAQQYAWVEESSPRLFAQIRDRVRDGHWEPGGGMWIEPDCNLPSGESLVRQITHGVRYWRDRFADQGEQTYLYLPDTFGFCAALPQIMRLSGLRTFITHKLSWNQTNPFPHTTFRWRGLDGTETLAHCMPGHDYNLLMSPRELRRGEHNHANKDLATPAEPARYLQPFGYGDGGGGPTDWQILNALLAADCDGLPRVRLSRVDDFCAALHADRDRLRECGRDLPVWDGELYLEAHRATYTTQAWIKLANRRAESDLRTAEILTWAGPDAPAPSDAPRLHAEQDAAWKLALLNQFHDIIPGSSIGWVYDDAHKDYGAIRKTTDAHTQRGLDLLGARMDTSGARRPVLVFNPTSTEQSAVIEVAGVDRFIPRVPALGVRVIDADTEEFPRTGPVRLEGTTLRNGLLTASIDSLGRIGGLCLEGAEENFCAAGRALNELVLYEDTPRNWDAWDLDPEYEQKPMPVQTPASIRAEQTSPMRARVVVERALGEQSRITQEYTLCAGSPRLDIVTLVDWRESHRILRALFPTSLVAKEATYDSAFGVVARATHRNTPFEQARFEVPAHRWMDLTDDATARGLALLNDCKYGHSCLHSTMGLSLLRAPIFPDPNADRGVHRFTYSLMPHAGDWRRAAVDTQAELLNAPLRAHALKIAQAGELGSVWAPIEVDAGPGGVLSVAALKAAEAGPERGLILRLIETRGRRTSATIRWNIPVASVRGVDLLERPLPGPGVAHDVVAGITRVELAPFQICTLSAERT